AAVEPEDKFVEIMAKLLVADRPLVGSQQPAFQQRSHPMSSRQQNRSRLWIGSSHGAFMRVARDVLINDQAVGSDRAAWLDHVGDKRVRAGLGQLIGRAQPYSSDPFAIHLSGYHYQGLLIRKSAFDTYFASTPVALIHLHYTVEPVSAGPHHRTAQLVQHRPRCPIAAQAEFALQIDRTYPVLLAGDVPNRTKPGQQGHSAILENRSRGDRDLPATPLAKPQSPLHLPSLLVPALRTSKPVDPSQIKEILPTCLFTRKARLHFLQ